MNPDSVATPEETQPETEEVKALPHQIKPIHGFDTYVPEDKTLHESIGIYRVYDRNGTPKVQFDHTRAEENEEEPVNVTITNTDAVEQELSEKDNDTYRRQHAVIS